MDPNQNDFQNGFPPVDLSGAAWRGRRMAISSFIFGLAALLFLFLGGLWFDLIAIILSIVFAIISRKQAGKWNGFSIAGLVIGIIALVATVAMVAIGIYIVMEALKNPDGEIAKLLDQYLLQTQGKTLAELLQSINR